MQHTRRRRSDGPSITAPSALRPCCAVRNDSARSVAERVAAVGRRRGPAHPAARRTPFVARRSSCKTPYLRVANVAGEHTMAKAQSEAPADKLALYEKLVATL